MNHNQETYVIEVIKSVQPVAHQLIARFEGAIDVQSSDSLYLETELNNGDNVTTTTEEFTVENVEHRMRVKRGRMYSIVTQVWVSRVETGGGV